MSLKFQQIAGCNGHNGLGLANNVSRNFVLVFFLALIAYLFLNFFGSEYPNQLKLYAVTGMSTSENSEEDI